MEPEVREMLIKVGSMEGRLGAMEQRLDRHESLVSNALDRFGHQIDGLSKQIDKIESKLDREEGARLQGQEDQRQAEKVRDAARDTLFSKENINAARWMVVLTALGLLVGALGGAHLRILTGGQH